MNKWWYSFNRKHICTPNTGGDCIDCNNKIFPVHSCMGDTGNKCTICGKNIKNYVRLFE